MRRCLPISFGACLAHFAPPGCMSSHRRRGHDAPGYSVSIQTTLLTPTMIRTALLALAIAAPLAPQFAYSADLVIHVDNVKSATGQVLVALYDNTDAFLKRPVRVAKTPATMAGTTLVFRDLAPGEYGFSIFHDANDNGRMDRNLLGIPTEPIAFSHDAQGRMGPPAFDAVKLAVPAAGLDTTVTLR
jgi:uncharacterized protein (DUF2141 family)